MGSHQQLRADRAAESRNLEDQGRLALLPRPQAFDPFLVPPQPSRDTFDR